MEMFKEVDALQDEINKHRPLDKKILEQFKNYYKIGLTDSETKVVIEEGITIGGKPLRDHLEAKGLGEAYDLMYQLIQDNRISEDQIKKLHKIFYYRIDEKNAGVYRNSKVFITGSKYPTTNPENIAKSMSELVNKINELKNKIHPVKLAAVAHKEFVFIHPFLDGNGRVARLLMNLILLQADYNLVIIPPIVRSEYIRTLEQAHKDDSEFIAFIVKMLKETQRDYLRLLSY